jgi:hypothetical protein
MALFQALRDCLNEFDLELHNDPDILLLSIGNTKEYANGFARQKRVALHLNPINEKESVEYSDDDDTSYPATTSLSTTDHAAFLLKKMTNGMV